MICMTPKKLSCLLFSVCILCSAIGVILSFNEFYAIESLEFNYSRLITEQETIKIYPFSLSFLTLAGVFLWLTFFIESIES